MNVEGLYNVEASGDVEVLKDGNYMYIVRGGQGAGAPFNEQMQFNGNKNPFNTKSMVAVGGSGGGGGLVIGKVYAHKGDVFSATIGEGGVAASTIGGISTGGKPSCFSYNRANYYAGGGGAGGLGGHNSSPVYPVNENTNTGFSWAGCGAPGQGGRPGNYIGGNTPAHNNSTTGGYGGGNTGVSSKGSLAGNPFGYAYSYSYPDVDCVCSLDSSISSFVRVWKSGGQKYASKWSLNVRGGGKSDGANVKLELLVNYPDNNQSSWTPQIISPIKYFERGPYSKYYGDGAHGKWYIYATYCTCDTDGVIPAINGVNGDVLFFYLDGVIIPGQNPNDPYTSGIMD